MTIDKTTKELNRFFDYFNNYYYQNQLPKPQIIIQKKGSKKSVLGWCTTKKIWNNDEGTESYYEITIFSEYLNISIEKIIGSLLHQLVHLHNFQNNIKDTSRSGLYHNKNFKEIAEMKGLIVKKSEKYGWSITTINEEVKEHIKNINPNLEYFNIARQIPFKSEEDNNNTKKSSSRKYICPKCEALVRATKDVNITCLDCKLQFIKIDE